MDILAAHNEKFNEAKAHLSEVDPILARLMNSVELVEFKQKEASFESLVKIIINQQLSNAAAKTIFSRVEKLCGATPITPKSVISLNTQELRECGISEAKVGYVFNLAKTFVANPTFLDQLNTTTIEDAYKRLIELDGIGPWSANIYLMFNIGKLDIFPYGDATLSKAIKLLYGVEINKKRPKHLPIIENWSPYRSIACLYLWKWIDSGMPEI